MKRIILTLFTASILFFGCNNQPKEHQHGDHNEPIELNKGEKWKVNEDMMVHIQNMQRDINSFEATSTDDYVALADKIETNIGLVASNCTMKGKAHDELHKWLLPYIDLFEVFTDSKTEQEYASNFEEIKKSFITFNTYFE